MFRDPWFRIVEIIDTCGLSLADIVKETAEKHRLRIEDIRGDRRSRRLAAARKEICERARLERPDLTSSQIGFFLRKEGSTVRHAWRQMEEAR